MKRRTLAILVASVLFGLSFTFSSCKACNKEEDSSAKGNDTDLSEGNDDDSNPILPPIKVGDDETPGKPTPSADGRDIPVSVPLTKEQEQEQLKANMHTRLAQTAKLEHDAEKKAIFSQKDVNLVKSFAKSAKKLAEHADVEKAIATGGNTANIAKAIKLLALRAELNLKYAEFWLVILSPFSSLAERSKVNDAKQTALETLEKEKHKDVNKAALDIAEAEFWRVRGKEKVDNMF